MRGCGPRKRCSVHAGNRSGRIGIEGKGRRWNYPGVPLYGPLRGILVVTGWSSRVQKKTQRTPAPEIELARKRLKELLDPRSCLNTRSRIEEE